MPTQPFECSDSRVAILWIVGTLLLGCSGEREPPYNPAVEILEHSPDELSNKHISQCVILINDQDLEDGVTVEEGATINIGGTMIVDHSQFTGELGVGSVHIRMQPLGTDEESWDGWGFAMEWIGPIEEELEFQQLVGAVPGVYEARVFVIMHSLYETTPRFDLVAKGTVTVVPTSAVQPATE